MSRPQAKMWWPRRKRDVENLWCLGRRLEWNYWSYDQRNRIMFTVGTVDVMSTKYRPSIGRYFVDAPRPNIGHMLAVYQSTVGDMWVNCRWHIGQLSVAYQSYVICIGKLLADTSVKYRSSIGQLSAKCRPSVCEVSVTWKLYRPTYISTDYRLTIDRLSTECRSTVDRVSIDSRSSVDRQSIECRSSVDRYVDQYSGRHSGRQYLQ